MVTVENPPKAVYQHGPVAVVYPQGKWISYASTEELIAFVTDEIKPVD